MSKATRNENMLTGNDPIQIIFGAVIRRIRRSKELTVMELAELIDTSQSYLSLLERGIHSFDNKHFWKLCDELCVLPSEVWKEVEELHAELLEVDKPLDNFAKYELRLLYVARMLLGVKVIEK